MIKKMAWNTFKKTGNIDTFLELMEVENLEKNIENSVVEASKTNGNIEVKRNSNSRTQYGRL